MSESVDTRIGLDFFLLLLPVSPAPIVVVVCLLSMTIRKMVCDRELTCVQSFSYKPEVEVLVYAAKEQIIATQNKQHTNAPHCSSWYRHVYALHRMKLKQIFAAVKSQSPLSNQAPQHL
jgi:hypothetical protein